MVSSERGGVDFGKYSCKLSPPLTPSPLLQEYDFLAEQSQASTGSEEVRAAAQPKGR